MALNLMNGQRQLGTSKAIRSRNHQARPFKTRPGKHVLACSTRPFQVGPWFQHRLINSKIVSNLSRPSRVETGEPGFLQQKGSRFLRFEPTTPVNSRPRDWVVPRPLSKVRCDNRECELWGEQIKRCCDFGNTRKSLRLRAIGFSPQFFFLQKPCFAIN
jgi:hypothetical protein